MSDFDQPSPPQWPGPPPVNRAQGCFGAVLWLVPTGFAVVSAIGLGSWIRTSVAALPVWGILNVLFIIATGYFAATLSRKVRKARPERREAVIGSWIVMFFLLQLIIVPVTAAAVAFSICLASGGMRF